MKKNNDHRTPHSVLLNAEEDLRIANLAARLTIERGRTQSKSAVMREAILWYVGMNEVGKKGTKCQPPKSQPKRLIKKQNHKYRVGILE